MQDLANRVALDNRVQVDFAVLVQADVNSIGVSEEIVQIAENLLISPEQEGPQVIGFAIVRVQLQGAADIPQVDELIDLAVRIAGNVPQNRPPARWLVQAVDRHDWEELLDGPT